MANTRKPSFAGWQKKGLEVIASLIRHESRLDAQSHNVSEILVWLRANHAPVAEKLPAGLEKLQSLGCKTFSWNGIPVSVICFVHPDGGLIHLMTTPASSSVNRALKREAKFVQHGHGQQRAGEKRTGCTCLRWKGRASSWARISCDPC